MALMSGCVLNQPPTTTPSSGQPPPPANNSPGSEPPGEVYHMDKGTNFVGLTVADAKAAAQHAGWTGKIAVYEETYDAGCKADTVCRFAPDDWKMKIGSTADLYFYVNPTVTISAPPPQ